MRLAPKSSFDGLIGNAWTLAVERHGLEHLRELISRQPAGPARNALVADLAARERALAEFVGAPEHGVEKGVMATA